MAFPDDPMDLIGELFVGSSWRDITGEMRHTNDDPVALSRVRPSEYGDVPPQRCEIKLDNKSGDFSPRNPLGDWYGTLGLNTPLRAVVRVARDTFDGRTVSNGWGTSSGGDAWSVHQNGGTVADFAVAGGLGTHTVGAATTYRHSYLASVLHRNVDVSATVTLPFSNVTGANVEPCNLTLRGVSTSDYYLVRVVITTTEAVTVQLMHANGTTYGSAVTVTGLTHTAAQSLAVRGQMEGQTFRAKVWAYVATLDDDGNVVSTGEPHDWHVTGHVADAPRFGWVGVRTGAATGNTNVSFVASYNDFEVRVPRFAGEVSEWPADWDITGNDAWVDIEAYGILRRLGEGEELARSAPRAYIPTSDAGLVAYWPLEDGPLSTSGAPVVGVNSMILTSDLSPTQHFGQGPMGPFLAPCLKLHGGTDRITGWVDSPSGASSEWTVDHVRAGGRDTTTILTIDVQGIVGVVAARQWLVEFLSASSEVRITAPGGTNWTVSVSDFYDDGAHHFRVFLEQDGADVRWWLDADGTNIGSNVAAGMTLTNPYSVQILDQTNHTNPFACGHIAVYVGSRPLVDFATPVLGWPNERALDRMIRLCAENDIPFAYWGDPDDTPLMGPQSVKTVLQLLRECADTDLGSLYETRGTIGLAYRARATVYNQEPLLTLPLSALRSAKPVDDPRATRNSVTVRQSMGAEYQVEKTTGTLSTAAPGSGGVGRYGRPATVNVAAAAQLPDIGGWLLHLGTVDEARYPQIVLSRTRSEVLAESAELLALDADDRLVITDALLAGTYDDISQLVRGYTEELGPNVHRFRLNCAPASPYEVIRVEDTARDKVDSGSSRLAALVNSSATTLSVATDNVYDLWATGTGKSIPILVGGEEMTVTEISGSSSPQTFTVTRQVNGVEKGHAADSTVRLFRRAIPAL